MKVRLPADLLEQARYWAAKEELSVNEYIARAVEKVIAQTNQDYDLPVLEVQRLNQIVDELKAVSENTASLERVVFDGLGSLLALARGDDYLLNVTPEG